MENMYQVFQYQIRSVGRKFVIEQSARIAYGLGEGVYLFVLECLELTIVLGGFQHLIVGGEL